MASECVKPPFYSGINRQNIESVAVDGFLQLSGREDALIGQDGYRHAPAHLGQQANAVARRRLLDKGQIIGEKFFNGGHGLIGGSVGAVGVDGEDRGGAEAVADGTEAGGIVDARLAGLELERADAGLPELDGQAHGFRGRISADAGAHRRRGRFAEPPRSVGIRHRHGHVMGGFVPTQKRDDGSLGTNGMIDNAGLDVLDSQGHKWSSAAGDNVFQQWRIRHVTMLRETPLASLRSMHGLG
jgi:hypothetical protein